MNPLKKSIIGSVILLTSLIMHYNQYRDDGVFDLLSEQQIDEKEAILLSRLADCPKSLDDLRKRFFLEDVDSPLDDVSVLFLNRNS